MNKIYKYKISPESPGGITHLSLPHGAKFLSLQVQRGELTAWFQIIAMRPENWFVEIVCRATGQSFEPSDCGEYLGTVQMADGALVLHAYLRDA